MNIFWLDSNPYTNMEYYIDKHVVKMITEYAQLLSSACRLSGVDCGYKLSHQNHPCAIWCRTSLTNWLVLRKMSEILHKEYQYRYGFSRIHKAYKVIYNLEFPNIPDIGFTPPPQCMPDKYKGPSTVIAYRNYYIGEKESFSSWKFRPEPPWFNHNGILIKQKDL